MSQPEYLGAGNDDGTILGRSSTDKVGFFNATPVARQSATLAAAVTAGTTLATLAPAVLNLYTALETLGLVKST